MSEESGEYKIRLVALPESIEGLTVLDNDGFANVYINSCLSYENRERVAWHELQHIIRDDAYNNLDIHEAEIR